MKPLHRSWLTVALATMTGAAAFTACDDDENGFSAVDNQIPTIEAESTLSAEPGSKFSIKGLIKDEDGIATISLRNEAMHLDKTIDLLTIHADTLYKAYNLDYSYSCSEEWTDDDEFPLTITVVDVLGNTATKVMTIKGDGDETNPKFASAPSASLTVLTQNPNLTLNATVTDNKELAKLEISIPDLDIKDVLTINGKEYKFSKVYTLPETEGEYKLVLKVYDAKGNVTESESVVSVSELPDFAKMYLADVSDAAQLTSDLYGVPMLIEHTGEYQYTAHYYCQKAGTGVRFIPQKTDFNPICFGIDESTGLLTTDPSVAQEIVLDKVGYYEIKFDAISGEYSVTDWTPETTAMTLDGSTTVDLGDGSGNQPQQICLAGSGLPNTPSWTTNQNNDAFILNQDKTNPYRLYREMQLTKGDKLSFTISQTHWWAWWPEPFWRFDNSDENEANVLNGGDNMKEVEVTVSGTYLFEFDYALLRSRIILVSE